MADAGLITPGLCLLQHQHRVPIAWLQPFLDRYRLPDRVPENPEWSRREDETPAEVGSVRFRHVQRQRPD